MMMSPLPNFLNFNYMKSPPHFSPPRLIPSHPVAASNLFFPSSKHFECPSSLSTPPNQSVAAIVFGDGPHWGLYPLTKRRSEAALPIAGNYRLVDAVMSNCINSNITKIYALTQFNSTSLNSHLSRAYSRARIGKDGFVEVVAAYQSPEGKGWFQGTADAIRRCLWILEEYPVLELLVLPGYHLYKMDYQKLIEAHRNNNADITVAVSTNTTPRHNNGDSDFGYFHVNTENRVTSFSDKPETKGTQNPRTVDIDGSFPSMGIYVISRDTMIKLLTEYLPMANDLRSEVIPVAVSLDMKVNAYKFDGYWEDMRNIEAYYRANLESTKKSSKAYNFYDTDSPLYTLPHHLPPSIITDSVITDSAIGGGCILNRCNIKGTVVGMRTRVGEGAVLEDSVVLGSDKYEMVAVEDDVFRIPVGIGECSRIKKAILDKNVRIGKNVKIVNWDNVEEGNNEAKGYIISKGIVVILRGAVIPDGSIV